MALPSSIKESDSFMGIFRKEQIFLINYKPDTLNFKNDYYAWMASLEALKSILEGGFGLTNRGSAVRPKGRVKIKATQNNMTLEIFVK